ncbi:MAG: hypothetical protein IJY01_06945 [Clostridia bacterium]|nr:hypothetical protein [Clostridia bacterium]
MKDILEKLKKLQEYVEKKETYQELLDMGVDSYVEEKIGKRSTFTDKEPVKEIAEAPKEIKRNYKYLIFAILATIVEVIVIIATFSSSLLSNLGLLILFLAIIIVPCIWGTVNLYIADKSDRRYYNLYLEKCEEVRAQNKKYSDEYKTKMANYKAKLSKHQAECAEYDRKRAELEVEYPKICAILEKNIETVNKNIALYSTGIGERYHDFEKLEMIIRIIENGRADSLKEALNIYEEDAHRRKVEREEQTRTLLSLREANERAENEREEAQRRCWHCRHELTCSTKYLVNCSAYDPR